ncbi:MAG: asparagine synthase-related protein [Acidobacteria bacterium]|nr:asparagine synthase-related protein [Acidobacteriota bacterium]
MSVQFGRWNFDGKPVDPDYLERVESLLAPYGSDHRGFYSKESIGILYHAFHTTKESRRETQPHVTASGAILTWDGRLDNRADLIRRLRSVLAPSSTDIEIVAAAYEHWGSDCFSILIGDWALSIWDPHTRSVILAKDPIGTRHLYYSCDSSQVTWSTVLDPLVLFAGKTFSLCEEYIAGWFSFFPATHLTPYVGIQSVPPSSSVLIRPERKTVSEYWEFDSRKKVRYRTDAEYEEHFRAVFSEAVRRRLRSDCPILAELSGGMDSSSIVCMADTIIARGAAETPRLDTLSYYDDSEPNWNERPYFTKVEERRGRTGCHIDVAKQECFKFAFETNRFAATPGSGGHPNEAARQFAACLASQGNRVVLSGFGGDEVTGGVPTPVPELEDLLARAHLNGLAHQLKVWAINKRKPWFHLLFEAARRFFPPSLVGVPKHKQPAPWLTPAFVKRNCPAFRGYESRVRLFGPLPSFQENISTLEALQRQLGCDSLPSEPPYEKRYPYLDREFLEFMYAVPREQLVRPGQRRSLMRRALVSIVPDDLLNRKRKAFVARAPLAAMSVASARLAELTQNMAASALGIVDPNLFSAALQRARRGQEISIVILMRTVALELWLRASERQSILEESSFTAAPVPFFNAGKHGGKAITADKGFG